MIFSLLPKWFREWEKEAGYDMKNKKKPTAWEIFSNFEKLNGGIQQVILDLIKWLLKRAGNKK